jgi:Ty3 transposon capsid-like protein
MSIPQGSPQSSPQHSPQLTSIGVSSSAPPPFTITAQEAMERIAALEASNAQGHALVAQLQAKLQASSARSAPQVKVPPIPSFSGAVGFGVDVWLRSLTKHFVFYGTSTFPDDVSRIRLAVMYLEGPAMDWWEHEPLKEQIVDWSEFVDRLHSRFRPMQAATVARHRLSTLKQTGMASAYANIFQKELTPITDMSPADKIFFFRQGLKPALAQKVLEKNPKTLHEAMDIAVTADANYRGSAMLSGARSYTSQSSHRGVSSSEVAMDLSNLASVGVEDDSALPTFYEEAPESASSMPAAFLREYQEMKAAIQKLTAAQRVQQSLSAVVGHQSKGGKKSSSSSSKGNRIPGISTDEFRRCWENRLCLLCKKPGHVAADCSSTRSNE